VGEIMKEERLKKLLDYFKIRKAELQHSILEFDSEGDTLKAGLVSARLVELMRLEIWLDGYDVKDCD